MPDKHHFTLFSLKTLANAKVRDLLYNAIKENHAIPYAEDLFKIQDDNAIKENHAIPYAEDLFKIQDGHPTKEQKMINKREMINDIFPNLLLEVLLQAIVDDDAMIVKTILDDYPELLLIEPPKDLMIESKLTWHKLYAEEALTMAVKRKQIKMIELLLPYFDKLEQSEDVIAAKFESLSTWKDYLKQRNEQGVDEIVIPEEYMLLAQSLIAVFKQEDFPNGIPGEEGTIPYQNSKVPFSVILSEETELALSSLLNRLVPETPVRLDELIDPELLLLALYQTYAKSFTPYNAKLYMLNALTIRTIGLTQSTLIPETGKIFCEGVNKVIIGIDKGKEVIINPDAMEHMMKTKHPFYRKSRNSRNGSGFDYFCGVFDGQKKEVVVLIELDFFNSEHIMKPDSWYLERIMLSKSESFQSLFNKIQSTPTSSFKK